MNPSIQLVKTAYNQYSGTGKILALFFLSLFVLFFMEKEKEKRSMFLYPSFLLLLFALEPVWKGLFAQMGNLAFYRKVYFLLPVFLVIGVAGVYVIKVPKGKWAKAGALVMLAGLIAISGKGVWSQYSLSYWENGMKMPLEQREVMDWILAHENPKALLPEELIPISNQYSSKLHTFYEIQEDGEMGKLGEEQRKVYYQMSIQHMDSKLLVEIARKYGYSYIVLKEEYHFPKTPLSLLKFEKVATYGPYSIYEDREETL